MNSKININTTKKYPLYPENNSSSAPKGNPLSYYTSVSDEVRLSREVIRQREQKAIQKKKQTRQQKFSLAGAALLLAGTVTGGVITKRNNTESPINQEVVMETEQPFDETTLSEGYSYESVLPAEDSISEAPLSAEDILESNSELQTEYNKLKEAAARFSEELGEDGLALIKERVEALGNDKVEVIDVLKILWIESRGRIYEPDNPDEILTSFTGEAFGPFQLTADTVDFLNNYYGLTGTEDELDVMNPYDNLDACIYNLKFLTEKRSQEINDGIQLPTGDSIKDAVAWSYHDGAWASTITDYGQDYIDQFRDLSIIDNYPSVVEYLLG